MAKQIAIKIEVINKQPVVIKVYESKWAKGARFKKEWTAKSKNYKMNGNLK